jgi:hypothetical protein
MADKTGVGVEETPVKLEIVNVEVEGHKLISKKLFDLTMHLLIENGIVDYDCVSVIAFTEDMPVDVLGHYDTDTGEIEINLQRHFDMAVEVCKEEPLSYLELRSHLWYGLAYTVIHEILHATAFAIDPESMLNDDRDTIEDNISEEAVKQLGRLIRDYDMEPADLADEPFFGTRCMEFYVKHVKENAEQWAINQNETKKSKAVWKHGEAIAHTFRDWYRSCYDHNDDTEWDKEVEPLSTVEVEDELGFVPDIDIKDDVIALPAGPVAETVVVSPSPEIMAVVDPVVAETVVAVSDTALPAGWGDGMDPESLALMDMDEPMEVDMEQAVAYGSLSPDLVSAAPLITTVLPAEPTPAPVQTALPLTVESNKTCTSCAVALAMNVKFCSNCGTSVIETPMPILPSAPAEAMTTGLPTAPDPTQRPFASGAKRPMRNDLPNHNLSNEQIRAAVGEVFIRCYQHIFSKCGFAPGQNPAFVPELRNAVMEPVSVLGIPCIDQIMVGMDSVDPMTGNFTWCVPAVEGMIRGKITKNLGLPSYTLYFNFNGHEQKRVIMPQNQWKVSATGGGYTGPAQRSQQGAMIIWMMDGDDSTPGQKWRAKIENGTLEWLV